MKKKPFSLHRKRNLLDSVGYSDLTLDTRRIDFLLPLITLIFMISILHIGNHRLKLIFNNFYIYDWLSV